MTPSQTRQEKEGWRVEEFPPDPGVSVVTPRRLEVMLLPYLIDYADHGAQTARRRKTRPSNSQMGTAQV